MAQWTVFKARGLGAGQSLTKLGTVEAANEPEAMAKARQQFEHATNPHLEGLLLRATRPTTN